MREEKKKGGFAREENQEDAKGKKREMGLGTRG
jgi:hypothetical protein